MEYQFTGWFADWPALMGVLSALMLGAVTDISNLLRELKDDKVPEMWMRGHTFTNRIMSAAEKKQVNTRAYIIPRWTADAGDARSKTFEGDSYANGTNAFTDEMTVSPVGVSVSFSATEAMRFAARNTIVAVQDFWAKFQARRIDRFKDHMECWWNANSNDGIAAILSGVQNTTEYLMDSADDPYGGYLLIPGATYQIIASASFPDTVRATAPHRVIPGGGGLNKRAVPAYAQFAQSNGSTAAAITGFTAEDRVVFHGLGNAGFASLPHLVSSLATGTVQGVSRTDPENRPTRIDGGGNPVDAGLVRRLYADIFKYRGGMESSDDLIPYCSQEQIVNWLNSAQAVANIQLTDASGAGIGEIYDRFLGDVKVNKKKPLVSSRANPTQFRFIRLSDFMLLTVKDVGMRKNVAGGVIHEQHDADGLLATAYSIHVDFWGNLAFRDVAGMGVIYNLSKPTLGD